MRRLETQGDGWRFACDVLRQLQEAGPEKCRANLPPYCVLQADALILALADLKERGTTEALVGFAQILTDLAGTRCDLGPSFYEQMARSGNVKPFKLKRLVNNGNRLAVLALRRENEPVAAVIQTKGDCQP
jgi:hypothetical protein